MNWLAIDIGGANIKVADGRGHAVSIEFPLWKQPDQLTEELVELISHAPPTRQLAVTMTGELCDCYTTKSQGVRDILQSVAAAVDQQRVVVYQVDGKFVSLEAARQQPLLAAASNWRALAQFATRFAPSGAALLIDIGSTTTDVIPLIDGQLVHQGSDDTSRLILGELVYSGVARTPLNTITNVVPYRDQPCPMAAELFATTRDAYLTLGLLPEEPNNQSTANGQAATIECARDRLAHQICADREQFDNTDAENLSKAIHKAQLARVGAAAVGIGRRLLASVETVIVSGVGDFLAVDVARRLAPQATIVPLRGKLGERDSACAPAYALAVLAAECQP